jgi:uroporphyrinogen III methyltransferase/synthase
MRLQNRTVVITRPRDHSSSFVRAIEEQGGRGLVVPAITIAAPETWEACDRAIGVLASYDGIVYTSANAVRSFVGRCAALGVNPAGSGILRVFAVGAATAHALQRHAIRVDRVPAEYTSVALSAMLSDEEVAGRRFLFPRGSLGGEELERALAHRGATVDAVCVYRTLGPGPADAARLREVLLHQEGTVTVFASPSAARNVAALFTTAELQEINSKTTWAVIGPTTEEAVRALGMEPSIVARESTVEGIVRAIIEYEPRNP